MATQRAHRQFIQCFVVLTLGVALVLVLGNYILDPFLIHQWNTAALWQKQPGRERLSAWGKTYALARLRPSVVFVGNSRTELGLPVESPLLSGQTVFNAALSGGSLADSADMLKHAVRIGSVQTVVWGLDFPSFSTQVGNTEFDRSLIAGNGNYRLQRWLLDMRRGFSLDMSYASLELLLGGRERICLSSLALLGQRDEACMQWRLSALGGSKSVMLPRLQEFLRGSYPTPAAFQLMRATLDSLCQRQLTTFLYINPTHAMSITALYRAGWGSAYRDWLRQLTALVWAQRENKCQVRLFDFAGINAITSEAVPAAAQPDTMQYYWETSHYRRKVGQMIIQRMLASTDSPLAREFGQELLPGSLWAYLQSQQLRQQQYLVQHPHEAQLIERALRQH